MPISAWTVLAALLAGLAVAGLVRSPGAQVRRERAGPAHGERSSSWGSTTTSGQATASFGWRAAVSLAGWMRSRIEPRADRRRRHRLVLEIPQALELMAASLAVGMPLRRATAAVTAIFDGPVAEDLGAVLQAVGLGGSDAEAWRLLQDHPQLGPAAVDLARSAESGTMMVESLNHHAQAARQARRATLEVSAKAVGVRSVLPMMMCFIPAFLLLGIVPTVGSALQGHLL